MNSTINRNQSIESKRRILDALSNARCPQFTGADGVTLSLRAVWNVREAETMRAEVEAHDERAGYLRLLTDLTAVQTIECACGDYSFPLVEPVGGDDSTWCECGTRIADVRSLYERVAEQTAATL